MIDNFEEETAPLSQEEWDLIEPVVKGLKTKLGEKNCITSDKMSIGLQNTFNVKVTGARIRKIINYIRRNGLVENLIASSKGYYIENDPEKIKTYVAGLRKRAQAINAVANSFKL